MSARSPDTVLFLDDAQSIVAFGRVDLDVRCATTGLVPDRRYAIPTIPLQQPEDLPPCQAQHVRRVLDAQPTILHLSQHFHAVQLALAHYYPYHIRSFSPRFARRVTLLNRSRMTLSLCGYW